MSEGYRVAVVAPQFVYVQESDSYRCQLANCWGHVPVQEMIGVLRSPWGVQQGWVEQQSRYSVRLGQDLDVIQTIEISEFGQVEVRRTLASGENVEVSTQGDIRRRQKEKIDAVSAQADASLHDVIFRTMQVALPAAVQRLGHVVTSLPALEEGILLPELTLDVVLQVE